jgi:hypothetical protein
VLVQSGQLAPATLTVGSGFTNSGTIELRSYNEGLCAQPPPRTPARLVDLFQAADTRTRTGFGQSRGGARLAVVPACALREIGRSKGRNSAENSGACMNCHAIDDAPRGA